MGGIIVVDSFEEDKEEQMEEDKEVEKVLNRGNETKRKILTGMSNVSDTVQNIFECNNHI